jgi:methyl-accepting chemotaxis protein
MIRHQLNGAIFQLQAEAGQIDHTGASVKEASELLSRGASSAASITQTGASLSELSKRTGSNANSAQHACRVSAPTVSTAEAAGQEMIRMLAAMTELKKAGSGISTIIRVIDNIAFQIDRCRRSSQSRTPMLGRRARNRAVDRRYGSQERRRITHQRSGCRPDDGHHNPRARVEPTRRRISQACGQQSQGIHQIKQAVSQIESVTQSTAHNAERTATAAACLKNNPKR